MDKFGMKLLPAALLPAVCVLSFVSCVNKDYNIDKLNTEVTFAKSGLSFPIGNTRQLTIKDFIGDTDTSDGSTGEGGSSADNYLTTTVDGQFAFTYSDEFSAHDLLPSLTDKLKFSDIVYENPFSLKVDDIPVVDESSSARVYSVSPSGVSPQVVGGESGALKPEFDEKFELILISAKELPADAKIKGVSQVVLDDVYANIVVDILTDIGTDVNLEIEMSVDFPSEIILDASDARVSDNSLKVKDRFKGGEITIAPVRIRELDLSKYDFTSGSDLIVACRAHGTVTIDNENFSIDDIGGKIDSKITLSIRNIKFKRLAGKFEYAYSSEPEEIDFSDLPGILKNGVLDFYNPYLAIDLKSNLNIPMTATIRLTPEWETATTASDVEKVSEPIDIKIPYEPCSDASKPAVQKFFVAAMDRGRSEEQRYIESSGIKALLKRIPDRLKVETSVSVDSERESVIEPAVATAFDADYSLVCPLAFGPDLYIESSDTLTGIDETLAGLMVDNVVQVAGSAINTMPIELELRIDLLDGSDNVLPLKSEATQTIGSCNSHGEPCITHLCCTLDVDESVSSDDIKSMKLTYRMKSGSAVGIPIAESSYVQAQLSLTLPQGLTMDLKNKDKDGEENEKE